ncbi:tetratricopeptide repeat protein, partial [Micromonospora humida]
MRDWLVYCDQVHQANGRPSLSVLAKALNMTSRTRIGEMLRGLSRPADEAQARDLLTALGAVGGEVERGLGKYRAACAEHADQDRVVRHPDWWLRSGYVQQVGDIVPEQLLDRDAELAELAAWCTSGDEAYVWWQAGPRAGKSALMAWFVLHPPPRVWVVSFFVTARYTGQADSSAFTDELIDQLAAITGQQVPPVTSSRERDRVRRQLFDAAVERAVRTGRRLVLLVDGLDEDCGSLPGSGLPSIAKCLPRNPAAGVRVIVAGRPDPPLPADISIDPDHPLRHCRIRALADSPHARQAMLLAQDELDQVLARDPDRHDGLGYQVLGLVTASGGGLSHQDLQQLTGRPAFEIDRLLLQGVFGRTIAGRADPHTTDRVFLFTHETLRVQAVDRLGRDTLTGFAARLHTWADAYQHRGWPADTPAYVLRGYPRMLADTKDLTRLVALATDPARHDRMLDATGGDAAALAEIATAHALIGTQSPPDLLAALRLAWYRDQLADRNTHIPTGLPALWATLGQPIRAEALARSITHPYLQGQALAVLVEVVAASGEFDRAEQIARSITDPYQQSQALTTLAKTVAAATDEYDRAEQILRSITHPYHHGQALAVLVEVVAASGEFDRAEQIARSVTDPYQQARALTGLVEAVAASGEHDHARAIATSAAEIARTLADPYQQTLALIDLAKTVAATGEHDHARAIANDAEQIARIPTRPDPQAWALTGLVEVVAASGEFDHAEQIARSIADPDRQVWALTGLVEVVAASGEF